MTKRKLKTIDEYLLLINNIRAQNARGFIAYLAIHSDLDIYDLSELPQDYQVPLLLYACRHCSEIAVYLIEYLGANPREEYRRYSTLRAALYTKETNISLYLIEILLALMLADGKRVHRSLIDYIDARTLFEPENATLNHLVQLFNRHNEMLEVTAPLPSFSSLTRNSSSSSSSGITVSATTPVMFARVMDKHERNICAMQQVSKNLARAMHFVLHEIDKDRLPKISQAINELIQHFKELRELIDEDLTLPKIYVKYTAAFPPHFIVTHVQLLRKYQTIDFNRRIALQPVARELFMLAQIIGAEEPQYFPKSWLMPNLKAC